MLSAARSMSRRVATFATTGAVFGGVSVGLSSVACDATEPALSKSEFRGFRLAAIETISRDTKLFRVALPTPDSELGMTTSGLLMVQATDSEGNTVSKPYTPTTLNDTKGHFDLVIKEYPGGKVSGHVHALQVGDEIFVKGCYTKKEIKANDFKKIGMIAGGSGITPMLQVAKHLCSLEDDLTEITLLFCNKSVDDIILKDQIDALAAEHPMLSVQYCVDKPAEGFSGLTGYVDARMLKEAGMPAPGDGNLIMVCGPAPMVAAVCGPKDKGKQGELGGILKAEGYSADMVFKL